MHFLWIACILALMSIMGITSADVPSLVGNWTGPYVGYEDKIGFVGHDEGSFSMNITEQKERIFAGFVITTDMQGNAMKKAITGVISPDNTGFYLAEQMEGYAIGYILREDKLEIIYLQFSDPIFAGIDYLDRVS